MALIRLDQAEKACDAALAKAAELGIRIGVSVVDEGGRLVLAKRADGANFLLLEWAQAKAVAASAFGVPTLVAEGWKADDPYFWQTASAVTRTPFLPSTGAVPLRVDGVLLGAIGCSGASGAEDHTCASAGAAVLSA